VGEGHTVTVIDERREKVEALIERYDVSGVVGNGACMEIQREAGMRDADLAIVLTNSDELNVFACLVAKKIGVKNTIARVLRLDGLTVGTEKVFEEQDDRLMGRFLGDLYPYFKGDIIFDQSNVRRDLGDKVLDWTYGVQGLEKLIRSFFVDYFPNVDWIQQLATTEPDREPKRSGN
jgi:hypothetical protein